MKRGSNCSPRGRWFTQSPETVIHLSAAIGPDHLDWVWLRLAALCFRQSYENRDLWQDLYDRGAKQREKGA